MRQRKSMPQIKSMPKIKSMHTIHENEFFNKGTANMSNIEFNKYMASKANYSIGSPIETNSPRSRRRMNGNNNVTRSSRNLLQKEINLNTLNNKNTLYSPNRGFNEHMKNYRNELQDIDNKIKGILKRLKLFGK